jgi:Secretion system C-terminal sorting domain
MKTLFTLALLLITTIVLNAQITVGANDFANANDTVRVSIANTPSGLNYKATGADTTWDYSFLQWSSQRVDKLLDPINTNVMYALYFGNVGFNSHRANIASPGTLNINITSLLTVNNLYNFFYKSNSSYIQQGLGMSIDNIPTTVSMINRDTLYKFPIHFGDADQVNSSFKVNLPLIGGVLHQQTRTNQVDGWGTLITPFGTFPVIRVYTQIASYDSVYIDTLHAGLNVPRATQRQYKWIGNGQKEPLLEINTQVVLGIETISSIVYRDSVRNRPVVSGIDEPAASDFAFNVYPNPSSGNFVISYANEEETQLVIADLNGKELMHKTFTGQLEMVDASAWAKGIYLVMLTNHAQTQVRKIVVE